MAMIAAQSLSVARPRGARLSARSARRATGVCRAVQMKEVPAAIKIASVGVLMTSSIAIPALAVVDATEAVGEVRQQLEGRFNACGTDECRKAVTSLANRKFARLTGVPAGSTSFTFDGTAPPLKSDPPRPASPPKPEVAVPKPAAVVATPTPAPAPVPSPALAVNAQKAKAAAAAERAAADKAAAEKAAAERAAAEKTAAEKGAAEKAATAKAVEAKKAADAKKAAEEAAKKKEDEERRKKSQGINPIIYETGFLLKGALAAGAVSAPFIYLKKDEVLLNESGEVDADKFVGKVKETYNSVPNAPVVAAYGAAGAIALSVVDGAVNLPIINILIGGPAMALGLRYVREGKSWEADFKNTHAKLNNIVPDDLPRPLPETLAAEWEAKK